MALFSQAKHFFIPKTSLTKCKCGKVIEFKVDEALAFIDKKGKEPAQKRFISKTGRGCVGRLTLPGRGQLSGCLHIQRHLFSNETLCNEDVPGGNGIGDRNVEGKMLLEFCDEKELCVVNTWFRKGEKRKVTYSAGRNESKIDFVLVGKGNRKYPRDVKVIPGKLKQRLVVVDQVKKKVKKVARKEAFERRKVWRLKEDDTRARFEERVGELVRADALDLWKCFREGMLKAFDEVCGKTKGRRDQGDRWWWNKDMKEAIARKKDAHKEMCKSGTEANKARPCTRT